LKYLQEQILARGGTIDRLTVPSLKSLAQIPHSSSSASGKPDIIVNCSGLGSRNLPGVHDHQMFPTRGQIVIVKVPESLWPKAKQFTMERYAEGSAMGTGTITYIIPRDNGEIVLGGTMQHWN
jgi:glycine/D-amino acid oxidase-like deaminating enzyme